jgi:HK97 family phage prohead protease
MIETYSRTWDLDSIEIQRGGDGRTVTAYAAVFGQDAEIRDQHGHYIERIDARAFAKTLSETKPHRIGVLYNHGMDATGAPNMVGSVPIGTPLEVKADGRGLLTVTRYNKSELADAVLAAISDGQIRGQSFRGRVYQSKRERGERLPVITRTELGLREYGPTHSPAYEGAGIIAVRSTSEVEEMVRTVITNMFPTLVAGDIATPVRESETVEPLTHSGRTHARRNAMLLRARDMGVISGQAAQEHRD